MRVICVILPLLGCGDDLPAPSDLSASADDLSSVDAQLPDLSAADRSIAPDLSPPPDLAAFCSGAFDGVAGPLANVVSDYGLFPDLMTLLVSPSSNSPSPALSLQCVSPCPSPALSLHHGLPIDHLSGSSRLALRSSHARDLRHLAAARL